MWQSSIPYSFPQYSNLANNKYLLLSKPPSNVDLFNNFKVFLKCLMKLNTKQVTEKFQI